VFGFLTFVLLAASAVGQSSSPPTMLVKAPGNWVYYYYGYYGNTYYYPFTLDPGHPTLTWEGFTLSESSTATSATVTATSTQNNNYQEVSCPYSCTIAWGSTASVDVYFLGQPGEINYSIQYTQSDTATVAATLGTISASTDLFNLGASSDKAFQEP